MSTSLPLSGVNSRLFSAIPLSCFSLKMSRFFFAYFELEKMRSMRSAQRQVELRRPGNQLPLLGKANSLCEVGNNDSETVYFVIQDRSPFDRAMYLFVNKCVRFACSGSRIGPEIYKDIPGYRSSGKIRVASRRCKMR